MDRRDYTAARFFKMKGQGIEAGQGVTLTRQEAEFLLLGGFIEPAQEADKPAKPARKPKQEAAA